MKNYRFRRGQHIQLLGREYTVENRLASGDLQVQDIATNEYRPIPETELLNFLVEGQLEFLGEGRTSELSDRQKRKSRIDDFNLLKDNDPRKIEAKRRWAYVKEIMEKMPPKMTRDTLNPLIECVHEATLDAKDVPHWKTVYYEWFVPFMNSGNDIRSLTPDYRKRGNRKRKFAGQRKDKGMRFSQKEKEMAQDVAKIVEDVIDEEYLSDQRHTAQEVWEKLDARITDKNRFRDSDDQLPIPHKSSLYNVINKLDEYEKDTARYGKRFADQKHRCNKQGPRPTRPLERVEIDHTTLDLFVVDEETKLPVGRPILTVAIDRFSRMILGMNVGFDPPSYMSVMLCLHHAILPKTYLKTAFPELENDWNSYGIPEVIVVDNGPEFYSEDLEYACLQMGTTVLYSPVRQPRYKAGVERFFGTQNTRLLHQQPGTSFSSIVARQDYDPKKHAIITFNALLEMLHVWIVDVYQQSEHRGIKDIPAHVWKEGVKRFPPALPRRREELRILLGHTCRRVVGPSGIELFTLYYNSDDLLSLRRNQRGRKAAATIKYDPRDLSVIYVYDEQKDQYLSIPAMDEEYTKGLSLWQHEVIKNYALQNLKGRLNIAALRRAKKKIQEIVEREWLKSGKTGARTKMARWRGIRQPDYDGTLVMGQPQEKHPEDLSKTREALVLFNPEAAHPRGASDVGQAVFHENVDQRDTEDNHKINVVLDLGTAKSTGTRSHPPKAKISNEQKVKITVSGKSVKDKGKDTHPALTSDDGELDMTGFIANYDLPNGEI